MKQLLNNKAFLALYVLWVLIHTFLLASSDPFYRSELWPFTSYSYHDSYDVSEWLLYIAGPLVIIFIWKSLIEGRNKAVS